MEKVDKIKFMNLMNLRATRSAAEGRKTYYYNANGEVVGYVWKRYKGIVEYHVA